MNNHRVCLTDFHNRYPALVTAEAKEQPFDSYKIELHFGKVVMQVLDQRRLGVNVFCVTELEKFYTGFLLEDLSSTLHMLHAFIETESRVGAILLLQQWCRDSDNC